MGLVIDKKTDTESLSFGFLKESISTTLMLIEISPDVFGVDYEVVYSGVKNGHITNPNPPISVSHNISEKVTDSPVLVNVTVSNYSVDKTTKTVSMHITVEAHSNVLGSKTLFDSTLGGKYGMDPANAIMSHLELMLSNMPQPQLPN